MLVLIPNERKSSFGCSSHVRYTSSHCSSFWMIESRCAAKKRLPNSNISCVVGNSVVRFEVTVEKRGQVGWSTSGRLCSCWELREPNGEGEQLNPQINRCCCCCFRTRRRPAVVLRCNKNPLVTTSPIDKHSHAVIHEDCDRAGGSNETGLFGTELSVVASDSSCVIVVELHSV